MSDLIDRQALRKAMYHEAFETDSDDQMWDSGCWIRYKMFERILDSMPPAQPEITLESAIDCLHSIGWMQEHDRVLTESAQLERKTGRWILNPNIYGVAYCSECDYELHTNNTNYCPNCGAQMEVDDGK